ncbi:MAG: tetratricopeptide repeat protein, partial [Methyloprofundus sp.]|nr:tetratricopeptide repeat protein [Methyloprofundus sp.]
MKKEDDKSVTDDLSPELSPVDAEKRDESMEDHLLHIFESGRTYYSQGDYLKAITQFKKYITTYPKNSNAYFNIGLSFIKMTDYKSAIKNFKQCIDIDPDYKLAYHNLANCYSELGQY